MRKWLPVCISFFKREQTDENGLRGCRPQLDQISAAVFGQCGDHTGTGVYPAAGSGPVGIGLFGILLTLQQEQV